MAMVLNTNVQSLNSQRHLSRSQSTLNTSLERLSSGLRINSAKDDAAGLAISERMTAQIRGLTQAQRNANDGISMAQTAEGALGKMSEILQRVRELAVQSANATNSASDRKALNDEVGQLVTELQRFATTTQFNGTVLLDGSNATNTYQVGADANQTISAATMDFRTDKYGDYKIGGDCCTAANAKGINIAVSNAMYSSATGSQVACAAVQASGTLTLNGPNGKADVKCLTGDSAYDLAQKINSQSQTGIKADARTETALTLKGTGSFVLDVYTTSASETKKTDSNSASISFQVTSNDKQGLAEAITAFNDASGKTGVTARMGDDGETIVLVNDEGKNINIGINGKNVLGANQSIYMGNDTSANVTGNTENSAAAMVGSGGTDFSGTLTAAGQVTLNASRSYSISTSGLAFQQGVLGAKGVGLSNGTGTTTEAQVNGSNLKTVASLDITTVAGATEALRIADQALDAVNSQRAKFGALQSRFEYTVANLSTTIENTTSARSRIQDTDFASETANMTKAQVLQQAGTAMLAQANSLPQSVLTLLN